MKEKILEYLERHPGARKRYIASYLRVWQCSHDFLRAMADLEADRKIRRELYKDPAQMEFFDKWYVVG